MRNEHDLDWKARRPMGEEWIPVDAYRLLRRIVVGAPTDLKPGNPDDDAASGFLVSRALASWDAERRKLVATDAGRAVGRLGRET